MQPAAQRAQYPVPVAYTTILQVPTPAPSEISFSMPRSPNIAIGAGPLYTNAIMGQALSSTEREAARKASSSILRQDCIQIEESNGPSPSDSFSVHYDCTSQAPYSKDDDVESVTQYSPLHLPADNPSHDLACFLRTTGPTQPHRRPSRLESSTSAPSRRRSGLRFLQLAHGPTLDLVEGPRGRIASKTDPLRSYNSRSNSLNHELKDEGGLLRDIQPSPAALVQQKVSTEGTKYLALQVPEDPRVLESRVSVVVEPGDVGMDRHNHGSSKPTLYPRPPTPAIELSHHLSCDNATKAGAEKQIRTVPARQGNSSPPTPEPQSAISATYSDWSAMEGSAATKSCDTDQALANRTTRPRMTTSSSLPNVLQLCDPSWSDEPGSTARCTEVRHPTPQRFASHPVLSNGNLSNTPVVSARSASNSPRLPPRSPLRARRAPQNIYQGRRIECEQDAMWMTASNPASSDKYNPEPLLVRPTVTTDCTGPIKRAKSPGNHPKIYSPGSSARRDREERTRARRIRDRPIAAHSVDAVVKVPSPMLRQRLKKARPPINMSNLQSTPQIAWASSSAASSIVSWRKITEHSRAPVSAVPSEDGRSNNAHDTPISPTTSNGSRMENTALSPIMLVAEQVPIPKPLKPALHPAPAFLRDGKPYAPRPRSASVPSIARRRSTQGIQTPMRPRTPPEDPQVDVTSPLPSPPPTRALPPIPVGSASVKRNSAKLSATAPNMKEIPTVLLPRNPTTSSSAVGHSTAKARPVEKLPHVVSKYQHKPHVSTPVGENSDIYARVEALERENAVLVEKFNTMCIANGVLQSQGRAGAERPRVPMTWENRIARRNAASRFPQSSSSGGNGHSMYQSSHRSGRVGNGC